VNVTLVQMIAAAGNEEVLNRSPNKNPISLLGILSQNLLGRRMEWDQTGLAEFRIANGQQTLGPIDILELEIDYFAGAHAGHHHQPQQAVVCSRPSS